jgi:ferredoxin
MPSPDESQAAEEPQRVAFGKYYVDGDMCVGCAVCVNVALNNFVLEDPPAFVCKQPTSIEEESDCREAITECPTKAIFDNGELRWATRISGASSESGWSLRLYAPTSICVNTGWSQEHNLVVIALTRSGAPSPPFEEILGAGVHRYLNLQMLASDAPLCRFMPGGCAFLVSENLRVIPLIYDDGSMKPKWQSDLSAVDSDKNQDSCLMIQLSDDLAIAAFLVFPSWSDSTATASVNFGVSVAGVVLAQQQLLLNVWYAGNAPLREHVSAIAQRIFASYAPPDIDIVEFTDSMLSALGIAQMTWDRKFLRAGENRSQAVKREINSSDVFQLFWSEPARDCKEVEQEWRHALSISKENFIRPVYWSPSLVPPPRKLRNFYFSKIVYRKSKPRVVIKEARLFFESGSALKVGAIHHMEKRIDIIASGQGNIFNIAEYMSGITNTVNQNVSNSASSDEVKELTKKLAAQIAEISPKIDPSISQQMGSDAKVLSEEMTKPHPRKPWYEISLNGIKEAATLVGEVGKPILEIVDKLLPLLLPQ